MLFLSMLILFNVNVVSVIGHAPDGITEFEHDTNETMERMVPLDSFIIPVILLVLGLFIVWKYFPKRTTDLENPDQKEVNLR